MAKPMKDNPLYQQSLDFVRENGPTTTNQLASHMKETVACARTMLHGLWKKGLLSKRTTKVPRGQQMAGGWKSSLQKQTIYTYKGHGDLND